MSAVAFFATKTVSALIQPPAGPVLLALVFLVLCVKAKNARWKQFYGSVVGLSLLSLLALSIPQVATEIARPLDRYPPISDEALRQAQAIVILGGGSYYRAPEYGQDTVAMDTLERLRYGARLAKKSNLPVLVTGGAPFGGLPLGESMRDALQEGFGVKPRWVETASRNTAENASRSALMLKEARVTRIALVSRSDHLARAVPLFERQGFTVFPAPTGFATLPPSQVEALLPANLSRGREAVHEYLGLLVDRLKR